MSLFPIWLILAALLDGWQLVGAMYLSCIAPIPILSAALPLKALSDDRVLTARSDRYRFLVIFVAAALIVLVIVYVA